MTDQGNATQPAHPFDPAKRLRTIRGVGVYMPAWDRLAWLRSDHPEAEMEQEHVRIDADIAIFRTTIKIPDGGSAVGYGSETAGDFRDYIEKAATKSMARALSALGYGTKDVERGEALADAPVNFPPRQPARPPGNGPQEAPRPPLGQQVDRQTPQDPRDVDAKAQEAAARDRDRGERPEPQANGSQRATGRPGAPQGQAQQAGMNTTGKIGQAGVNMLRETARSVGLENMDILRAVVQAAYGVQGGQLTTDQARELEAFLKDDDNAGIGWDVLGTAFRKVSGASGDEELGAAMDEARAQNVRYDGVFAQACERAANRLGIAD